MLLHTERGVGRIGDEAIVEVQVYSEEYAMTKSGDIPKPPKTGDPVLDAVNSVEHWHPIMGPSRVQDTRAFMGEAEGFHLVVWEYFSKGWNSRWAEGELGKWYRVDVDDKEIFTVWPPGTRPQHLDIGIAQNAMWRINMLIKLADIRSRSEEPTTGAPAAQP